MWDGEEKEAGAVLTVEIMEEAIRKVRENAKVEPTKIFAKGYQFNALLKTDIFKDDEWYVHDQSTGKIEEAE